MLASAQRLTMLYARILFVNLLPCIRVCVLDGDMATTNAPCIQFRLLACFLQVYFSQHVSSLRECHCTSGCDVDFRCYASCLKGWSGPTCQTRNIALNRPTKQSSTVSDCMWASTEAHREVCGNKTSSLAVDGEVSSDYWSGTCTHTVPDMRPAWWTVDLGETHLITNLRIFFSDKKRMQGFLVEVDHTHVCYRQSQPYPPTSPVNISCDPATRGQHVTVQLPERDGSDYILNLCEVEIYDCADGSFGPDCSSWCNCRNTSEACNKTNGHCESGCLDGSFGPGCNSRCNCRDTSEVCDKTTGFCESGCTDGYTGTSCQRGCPRGRYGSGCMEICGHCAGGYRNCHKVDGHCTHGCQEYWSGTLCKVRECHCTGGCDVDVRCSSECLQGWSGPTCQRRNIALNRPTEQSSTLNDCAWAGTEAKKKVCGYKTSSLAVDGEVSSDYWTGTCTHTSTGQTYAWWRVDLGETHLITNLGIFFSHSDRIRKFLVKVDGRQCYQSQSDSPTSPVNISCGPPTRGQNVTVELPTLANSHYILNLCEVEIYECADGSFGHECRSWCFCKNTSEVCNKNTGHCDSGCTDGRIGADCQRLCADGRFGPGCSSWCYCSNTSEVCDKTTGHCESGCQDGYTGMGCQETCPWGRYGSGCMETCGHCAGGDQNCQKVDGHCKGGCQDNWNGTLCKECSAYWFGDQCDRECRCKDTYEVCDTRTGQCDSGCEDGWTGLDCHSECQDGTYGFNCTGRCGRCQSGQSCYKIGGECESCAHGFKPPFCQVCEDYFYGEQCSSTCGHCRDNANCNNVSGECPDGCEPGWQGMTCHHECDEGRYGDGCAKACGRCAGTCSPVNGSCDQEGCRDGWTGQRCDEACPDGTFGQACSDQCGQCLGGEVCDKETGVCLGSWCERGWKGHRCLTDCNGTGFYGHNCNETCGMCIEELCDPITGECPRGCRIKYVGATCTVQEPSNLIGQVGAGVAYTLVAVLVVAMIIAMYFLRRRSQVEPNTEDAADSPDVVINPAYPAKCDGGLSEEGDADGIYVNVERTKVKVAELREYIARREDKFVSEYGRVPRGLIHPHTAATTPEHKPKNRFKAMYPYDHSRVVLQKTPGDKHSDYINANYIDTYARKKAFIATQGPMPRTVGDFWRMVWQEEADIIVMLTRLKEGIKVKCEKYWPEKKTPLKLGDMTITNDGVTERPDYCIRQITIQHKKLNERRQVMHLHYVTWPDHDVPSCPPLVRFWKVFRSMASDSKAPVVVHCSAGVGRTGTFIALEALMERARREGVVDVHEFVLKMRADRVSMVQTKEQYLFLHQVVLEALYSDMTHMTPTMFDSRFCTDNLASASEEAILKKEWEKLIELKEHLNASETEGALLPENSRKNRSMDILPADKYRPILTLPVAESNDYINAVFVPTETRQKRLLATQLPLPWTMVDFWRMVFDHNVQTVVSLVSEECSSQVDEALFWPKTNKVLECGPFRVEKLEPKNKAITLTVSLMDTDESTKREVMLMFVSDWEEGVDTPTNTSRFLCLINDLDVRIASDNIAVMCMDGASKCGLLCAVLNIIQRLKQDQEIDVYLTVRLLQTVRTSFVTSFVQYQFCYRMIKEYQKTNNTVYENFRGKGLVEQRNLQNR